MLAHIEQLARFPDGCAARRWMTWLLTGWGTICLLNLLAAGMLEKY